MVCSCKSSIGRAAASCISGGFVSHCPASLPRAPERETDMRRAAREGRREWRGVCSARGRWCRARPQTFGGRGPGKSANTPPAAAAAAAAAAILTWMWSSLMGMPKTQTLSTVC
eukprot:3821821-Rhodomonas_salina.3